MKCTSSCSIKSSLFCRVGWRQDTAIMWSPSLYGSCGTGRVNSFHLQSGSFEQINYSTKTWQAHLVRELKNRASCHHKAYLQSSLPLNLNYAYFTRLIVLSLWYPFILEEGRSFCHPEAYAYKALCFFIKDYTNKSVLRAWSRDEAEELGVTHP